MSASRAAGGQILLLRRFNTGYEDGKYSVVAGHLDELRSWPLEQWPDGMVPYVRAAIDHYRRGRELSEFGWSRDEPAR